ncbi:MAG: phenylacetic acid degradation operon negative regulatory protein PaaX [Chloroflexi bacterium]|nr:phenylacetic acid degradation operon negative regulatory protein PaaX [Chloroflexota bacterium]
MQHPKMNGNARRPQSLIFTLFGDYIRHRNDRVWIGALVKILALFDLSEPAVRSTVSRMARRGWLKNERVKNISYYQITPRAHQVIADGAQKIFQFPEQTENWDGCWHLVTYSIPEERRAARDHFRAELSWLGYGMLTNTVWISPWNRRARVECLAADLNIKSNVQLFDGQIEAFVSCQELVARCWNLDAMNIEYANFIATYASALKNFEARLNSRAAIDASEFFVRRFMLMHEFRRFPYRDPQLPAELLPRDWRGAEASALFHKYHDLLADGANKYFDSVFR